MCITSTYLLKMCNFHHTEKLRTIKKLIEYSRNLKQYLEESQSAVEIFGKLQNNQNNY